MYSQVSYIAFVYVCVCVCCLCVCECVFCVCVCVIYYSIFIFQSDDFEMDVSSGSLESDVSKYNFF